MSSKRALLASSLAICSTSASWMVGTDRHPVYAQELAAGADADPEKEQIAQEAMYQFLSPISQVAEGNLAATVETKPLTYRVKKGDTLSGIGRLFGVSCQELTRFNHLENPDLLQIGQEIQIPLVKKWIRLRLGDTVQSLAKEYQTTPEVMAVLNSELKESSITYAGQLLAVPQKWKGNPPRHSLSEKRNPNRKPVIRLADHSRTGTYVFRWPVNGQITSNFGWRNGRQHKGIDIWNEAGAKAEICASLGGVVTQAGYSGGYGNLVVIDHGGGWITYYAHLSQISVSKGEQVNTGERLGMMGQTGRATGYHLHFEVRKNGKAINPLLVLK
ncbi:M23 family metallopeptidase [Thermoactinomyces mirandus]|uniref:M23 family metallopeptidase n=1 Tax=Thermoactinomyces mirandus TaxID=2756294 RepID=A0A7W1XTE8_9BACL|nr:M23 family metallopeptidase [Thermoactinomyces mirandus]MBA4602938.1 M23 family metallopeptidase [Thermoactinomyces mirandus]